MPGQRGSEHETPDFDLHGWDKPLSAKFGTFEGGTRARTVQEPKWSVFRGALGSEFTHVGSIISVGVIG